ncbi:peptide deformylase, mitochondrial [Callorhinchus milii]|uniref:Peptide deformylase n=1 Tax=Callorhinchus milii TaxID=7868 RepID=A0A4W3GE55_CALMI|nr:peptide deformylase, mitochondrial [Callorhinchus milii]XP_007906134.1 peptide deformylase, mitochondrial [Callorhinchus milii]|eukprot:gi/632978828/ref/XP_007906133.1/ PREDICTED: peptide deformylase, mitochondrial [Callorhinchus milii]
MQLLISRCFNQRFFATPSKTASLLLRFGCLQQRLYNEKRNYWQYLKQKIIKKPSPPYQHVCQVGDPILRSKASPVNTSELHSPQMAKLIRTLVMVMREKNCIGLSAPQIGVPLQVIAMEFTEQIFQTNRPSMRQIKEMNPFSLKIFINPSVRVLDSRTVQFPEGCESISGFAACVPRYHAVEIMGLNEHGQPIVWQTSGWTARIVQHEMDHLNGILYIDKMDSKTFLNINWIVLNE